MTEEDEEVEVTTGGNNDEREGGGWFEVRGDDMIGCSTSCFSGTSLAEVYTYSISISTEYTTEGGSFGIINEKYISQKKERKKETARRETRIHP